jgi:hypothetical protein
VPAIVADVNIEGYFAIVLSRFQTEVWREIWDALDIRVVTFADLGLGHDASDLVLWQRCQQEQAVLVTANRNADDPDSLEAAIRA